MTFDEWVMLPENWMLPLGAGVWWEEGRGERGVKGVKGGGGGGSGSILPEHTSPASRRPN